MTRSRDVADSQDNLGGPVPPVTAGKNFAINGGMDIWQRGTSFSVSGAGANLYSADRWHCYSSSTGTISQDTSLSASGFRYGLKFTSSASAVGFSFFQMIETNQTIPLAGQQVALSGYNIATAGKSISLNLEYSTTVDDYLFGAWVQATKTTISQPTSTGSLLRYTYSFAVPTTAKSLRITLGNGSLDNTQFSTWTGIQLELGSTPTPFSKAGGTIQGELAACQRYYFRFNANGETNYCIPGHGGANSSTQTRVLSPLPVQMRVKPTSIDASAASTFYVYSFADGAVQCSTIVLDPNLSSANLGWVMFNVASGLTSNSPYYVRANNTASAYLGFSAEL